MVRLRWHLVLEVADSDRPESFYLGLGISADILEVRWGATEERHARLVRLGPLGGIILSLVHGAVVAALVGLSAFFYLRASGENLCYLLNC